MKFDKSCIVCGCSDEEKLSTILNIKYEGKMYPVALCEEHEDHTPKQIRSIIKEKIDKINEALAIIKEAGLDVSTTQGGIAVAEKPKPKPQIQEVEEELEEPIEEEEQYEEENSPSMLRKMKAHIEQKKRQREKKKVKTLSGSVSGNGQNANVEGYEEIEASDFIERSAKEKIKVKPKSVIAETQTVKGRAGQEIRIPKTIKHNIGGKTEIAVVNSGGDAALQRRFKTMANKSTSDEGHSYGKGFDFVDCGWCEGSGIKRGVACPKCKGKGVIERN